MFGLFFVVVVVVESRNVKKKIIFLPKTQYFRYLLAFISKNFFFPSVFLSFKHSELCFCCYESQLLAYLPPSADLSVCGKQQKKEEKKIKVFFKNLN